MIGQPPRQNNGAYDPHEQDRWFQDIYRHLQTLTTGTGTSTTTHQDITVNEDNTTVQNVVNNYNSKRYLRWFNC